MSAHLQQPMKKKAQKVKEQEKELQKQYATIVEIDINNQIKDMSEKLINDRILDSQKQVKEVSEEIKNNISVTLIEF